MTPSDYIIVQTILMIILVSATIFYAYQAKKASDSAKTSAEASAKMAEEMREQRLSEAQPYLVLRLRGEEHDTFNWSEPSSPQNFPVTILNAGQGPAINLYAALWHRHKTYFVADTKGYLTPREEWQTYISGFNLGIEEEKGWLPELRELVNPDYPGAISVEYQDVYKRRWVSYLCLERHPEMPQFVVEAEQNIVELKKDDS